ncbi:hypothetical protein AB0I35_15485 [Nocardia sp. NPDC050378]|uniref:hypothetical protein n=1 Tax=Nocardia sp. NPDC050378 TaxID=3155400 RepID=UPI0033E91F9A
MTYVIEVTPALEGEARQGNRMVHAPTSEVDISEWRQGARPLLTAFISYGLGPIIILQTNGLFVQPIMEETGLSATAVQIGSVVMLFAGIGGVGVGALLRKFNARTVAITGFLVLAALVAGLSVLASAITFYTTATAIGLFGSFCYQVMTSSLQPNLLLVGLPVAFASAMSMAYLLGVIIGRIGGGFLLDRFRNPYLVPPAVCVVAAGCALQLSAATATTNLPAIGVFVVVMATAARADADFPAFFTLRIVGRNHFPLALGMAGLTVGLSNSAGALPLPEFVIHPEAIRVQFSWVLCIEHR